MFIAPSRFNKTASKTFYELHLTCDRREILPLKSIRKVQLDILWWFIGLGQAISISGYNLIESSFFEMQGAFQKSMFGHTVVN